MATCRPRHARRPCKLCAAAARGIGTHTPRPEKRLCTTPPDGPTCAMRVPRTRPLLQTTSWSIQTRGARCATTSRRRRLRGSARRTHCSLVSSRAAPSAATRHVQPPGDLSSHLRTATRTDPSLGPLALQCESRQAASPSRSQQRFLWCFCLLLRPARP